MMRIIAGKARGHRIECLKGRDIRPTQDKIREAIFSTLMLRIPAARVLDLFAGTGALGLEALSRGAAEAVLVERSPAACALIADNCKRCRLEENIRILRQDALDYIRSYPEKQPPFDIIFADPPYHEGYYQLILTAIADSRLLQPDGILVVEAPRELDLPDTAGLLTCRKRRIYGDTVIGYYQYKD